MAKYVRFLKSFANAVYDGADYADTPTCPKCKSTMQFHGGELAYGDGYWDCSGCDYTFTENDLNQHIAD